MNGVLDDQVDVLARQRSRPASGRMRDHGADLAQRKQQVQCGADREVVVDHQEDAHVFTFVWVDAHPQQREDAGARERVARV